MAQIASEDQQEVALDKLFADVAEYDQIEADPARAGARIPTELPIVGDAKQTLRGLLPLLERRSDDSFLAKYQREMEGWRQKMASMEDASREPIAPQYLMAAISELATDDAILTCDSGTIATWAARHWTIRGDRGFYLSGNLATMAPGLPYAIGIQHAYPDRQVIAFVGDGGFAMLMAEFLTAIQHRLPKAKKFALAFMRGQPHRATIATTLLKDRIQQLKS